MPILTSDQAEYVRGGGRTIVTDHPEAWMDATGLCPDCRGTGKDAAMVALNRLSAVVPEWCGRCRGDGRKREALQVTCWVDHDVRHFYSNGIAVPTAWCSGLVTFAYATVEVLPVVDWRDAHCYRCVRLNPDGITISIMTADTREYMHPGDPIALDTPPVPGRDWVVLLDNVEVT